MNLRRRIDSDRVVFNADHFEATGEVRKARVGEYYSFEFDSGLEQQGVTFITNIDVTIYRRLGIETVLNG